LVRRNGGIGKLGDRVGIKNNLSLTPNTQLSQLFTFDGEMGILKSEDRNYLYLCTRLWVSAS
jgi:hypothetical protein